MQSALQQGRGYEKWQNHIFSSIPKLANTDTIFPVSCFVSIISWDISRQIAQILDHIVPARVDARTCVLYNLYALLGS